MRYLKSKIMTKIIIHIFVIIHCLPASRHWIRSIQIVNIIISLRTQCASIILIKQASFFYWANITSSCPKITKGPPAEDRIFSAVIMTLPQLIINCLSKCDGSCLHLNCVRQSLRKISWDKCVYWSLVVQVYIIYHLGKYFIHYRTIRDWGKKLSTNLIRPNMLKSIYLIILLYYWFWILIHYII